MLLIAACWWYLYRTAPGLTLQAVGENPDAAYARGTDPRLQRCAYAICGGALVGLAGATFSLCTKPGWGRPQGAEGTGWIALALVIFGGWHPVKAALGAYVFSLLQMMGIYLQGWFPSIPAQVFQVAPFPLMIFALALTSLTQKETVRRWVGEKTWARRLLAGLANRAPAGLGRPYRPG
jgi:simple sugar transport system permease protein